MTDLREFLRANLLDSEDGTLKSMARTRANDLLGEIVELVTAFERDHGPVYEEGLAEPNPGIEFVPALTFAWECPACGNAVEGHDRGDWIACDAGHWFTAGG